MNDENTFDLDGLNSGEDFEPPPWIANTIAPMNRRLCVRARVELDGGQWFLRWTERHTEMVSRMEYVTGESNPDEAERIYNAYFIRRARVGREEGDEWKGGEIFGEDCEFAEQDAEFTQLQEVLPYSDHELPITRRDAFLLVAAWMMPEEFWPELAKHDK